MTIKEYFIEKLFSQGMFREQAAQCIELVENEELKSRFNDNVVGYPTQTLVAFWMFVKEAALLWIDKNLPQAWYRPLFEKESQKNVAS